MGLLNEYSRLSPSTSVALNAIAELAVSSSVLNVGEIVIAGASFVLDTVMTKEFRATLPSSPVANSATLWSPTSELLGVPCRTPVLLLKLVHEGKIEAEKSTSLTSLNHTKSSTELLPKIMSRELSLFKSPKAMERVREFPRDCPLSTNSP